MDDRVDRPLSEQAIERTAITNVALHENGTRAGDLLDPVDDDWRAVAEVVEEDGFVTSFDQLDAGVRTDVAGAACQQNCGHRVNSAVRRRPRHRVATSIEAAARSHPRAAWQGLACPSSAL